MKQCGFQKSVKCEYIESKKVFNECSGVGEENFSLSLMLWLKQAEFFLG
jgi:hypothetical protein